MMYLQVILYFASSSSRCFCCCFSMVVPFGLPALDLITCIGGAGIEINATGRAVLLSSNAIVDELFYFL